MEIKILALASAMSLWIGAAQAKPRQRPPVKQGTKITPAMLRGKIVYQPASSTKAHELWSVRLDGTGSRRFWIESKRDFASIDEIAVSPDGSRVAFIATPPGDDLYKGNAVWLSDLSGRHRRIIDFGGYAIQGGLAWSPNGKSLLWTSGTGAHSGGPMTAYCIVQVAKADGTAQHSFAKGNYQFNAQWDRQGRRIRYWSFPGGRSESPDDIDQKSELRSANSDGSQDRLSIGEDAAFQREEFSADGKMFVSTNGRNIELHAAGSEATRTLPLPRNTVVLDARFAPDGKTILLLTLRAGRFQGMRVNSDGSGLHRIGDGHPAGKFVQWLH